MGSSMKLNLKPYQDEGVKFLLSRQWAGLFLDMGLGKTVISLTAISALMAEGHVKKALIVAPIRVLENVWPSEIAKWDTTRHLRFANLNGVKVTPTNPLPEADIYGINPESLKALIRNSSFVKVPMQLLVIDESSMFKNASSLRFRALSNVLYRYKYRWILTGTPAPNGLLDVWSQIYLLDRGAALGPNPSHFHKAFCVKSFDGYGWEVHESNKEVIYKAIAPLILRMSKDDCLVMPELIKNPIEVTLAKDDYAMYKTMEREFLVMLQSGEQVMSPNAAVAGMRCRQIANGGLYLPDGRPEHIHNAKVNALKEIVEELQGEPLLVFYEFVHDLERIRKVLGPVPSLSDGGGVKDIVDKFNAGKIPVLVAHGASAGYGLNLQGACSTACWMGVPWDLGMHDQANARVWRQGQEAKTVTVHYLMAKNTLDYHVFKVLARKDKDQQDLLGALQRIAIPDVESQSIL